MGSGDAEPTSEELSPRRSIVPGVIGRSFFRKFAVTLLIVVLVVGGVSAFVYAQTSDHLAEDAEVEYTDLAERDAEAIADWSEERSINVQTVSEYSVFAEDDPDEINEFLSGEEERLPDDVETVHRVDLDENVIVASSDEFRVGTQLNIREAPWAWEDQDFEDDDVLVSEVRQIQANPTISFVSPIIESDDNEVLVITSNLDAVVDETDNVDTQIINEDGEVVAGALGQTELEANLGAFETYTADGEESTVVQEGLAGNVGFIDGSENEEVFPDHVTAYAPVGEEDTELVVAAHVATDDAYALQDDIVTSMLILVGATLIGLGFVAVAFGRGTVRSINRLSTKANALEQGNLDEEFEEAEIRRADEIGDLFRAFASMRDALRSQITDAEGAKQRAETARADTERMNQHLEAKAEEYQTVMQMAAAGDLSQRMDPESESEAMTAIAEEFNVMLQEIESTVTNLKSFATEVATASEEVTASSEEVRSASQQVTESIQEISDGSERQHSALQSANTEMSDLSSAVEQVATTSSSVATIAERTAKTGREGQSAAQDAIEGMSNIRTESEGTVEAMERLQAEMNQIDELLDFITEIASETNMLALNANIEASRSANSRNDEGFGVVAAEIKELAAETKDATQDIEQRLDRLKSVTDQTAEEVQTTQSQISQQTESVQEAADALEEIAEYAEKTNEGVQRIDTATQQQAKASQQVVSTLKETASISEQTTLESENVAAAAEEQTTALTEMSRSASDLSVRASKLSEALDRFETDEEDGIDSVEPDEPAIAADLEESILGESEASVVAEQSEADQQSASVIDAEANGGTELIENAEQSDVGQQDGDDQQVAEVETDSRAFTFADPTDETETDADGDGDSQ